MLTLLFILACCLSASYFYIESLVNGMQQKRWLVCGLLIGPFMLPMFEISKHMAWRKASGFNSLYMQA